MYIMLTFNKKQYRYLLISFFIEQLHTYKSQIIEI